MYSENMVFPRNRPIPWIASFSDRNDMGNFYSVHCNMPISDEEVKAASSSVGHPPHLHKENEIMFLIGMNLSDPYELGAEARFASVTKWKNTSLQEHVA